VLKNIYQYVTVSQNDGGPYHDTKSHMVSNMINNSIAIFIFSAGGWGDVPVPLVLSGA
jgi:hypothetical protein